jgi:O-antigen ligase
MRLAPIPASETASGGTVADALRGLISGPPGVSHLLALATLIAPTLALVIPLGIAPLFIVTAILSLALSWRQRPWTRLPLGLAVALLAIVAWAMVSASWSLDPWRSLRTALILAGETFLGMTLLGTARSLDPAGRERVGTALVAGVILGALVFAATVLLVGDLAAVLKRDTYAFSLSVRHLNRGVTVLVLLAWPGFIILSRRGNAVAAWSLIAAIGTVALVAVTLAAKIAMVMALAVMLVYGGRRRLAQRLVGSAIVLAIFAIPLGAAMLGGPQETAQWRFIPYSSHHRLSIWSFASQRIIEKPLLGWGMDSSRFIPGGDDEVVVSFAVPENTPPFTLTEPMLPLHPHNAVLQWWLELGAVGATLFALLLWRLTRLAAAPTVDPLTGNVAMTMLMSSLMIAAVSYGFWQSWWQATLWLLAVWMTAVATPGEGEIIKG